MQRTKSNIESRSDLSFTGREPHGHQHLINWIPPRVQSQLDQWGIGRKMGAAMVGEICALHAESEKHAYDAIRFAFNSPNWQVGGHGEEYGFSEEIAALAIVGMRALQQGAEMYREDDTLQLKEAAQ